MKLVFTLATCLLSFWAFGQVMPKPNELKISIQGNTGKIEELYSLNDRGQWRKANGHLQKIK